MIYARLNVDMCDHPRALAAGAAAFGLWSWGLAYARKHELDGELPLIAIRCAFGGGKANDELAATLVACGLWEATETGWRVVGYALENETRAQIAERREAERLKKAGQRSRRGVPPSVPPSSPLVSPTLSPRDTPGDSRGCPGSDSGSDSESLDPTRACARDPEPNAPTPVPAAAPTPSPAASAPRPRGGTFGLAADAWADGVRSVTGARPALAPWDRANLEDLARAGPPELEPCAYLLADGATFARRQRSAGMLVTAKSYGAWVASGRPEPPQRAAGRPELARASGAPTPPSEDGTARAAQVAEWEAEAVPMPGELLDALGGTS